MKFKTAALAALIIVLTAGIATAGDRLITAKASDVVEATTKNGAQYVRIIIEEPAELNGVKYTVGVPAMVFNESLLTQARALKPGDTVKMIVSEREYQGRRSMTVNAFVK